MIIYSTEFRLICNSWLIFFGYSNKVNYNLEGFSDDRFHQPCLVYAIIVVVRWAVQVAGVARCGEEMRGIALLLAVYSKELKKRCCHI